MCAKNFRNSVERTLLSAAFDFDSVQHQSKAGGSSSPNSLPKSNWVGKGQKDRWRDERPRAIHIHLWRRLFADRSVRATQTTQTYSSFLSRSCEVVWAVSAAPGTGFCRSIGGNPAFFSCSFSSGISFDLSWPHADNCSSSAFSSSTKVAVCCVVGAASAVSRPLTSALKPLFRRARLRPSGVLRYLVP